MVPQNHDVYIQRVQQFQYRFSFRFRLIHQRISTEIVSRAKQVYLRPLFPLSTYNRGHARKSLNPAMQVVEVKNDYMVFPGDFGLHAATRSDFRTPYRYDQQEEKSASRIPKYPF